MHELGHVIHELGHVMHALAVVTICIRCGDVT